MEHLPNEMLIAWDNIAIAIQKILNTHNTQLDHDPQTRFNQPQLEIVEFVRNETAQITYEDELEDNMPDMLAGPVYNKHVLHAYTAGQEDSRKL